MPTDANGLHLHCMQLDVKPLLAVALWLSARWPRPGRRRGRRRRRCSSRFSVCKAASCTKACTSCSSAWACTHVVCPQRPTHIACRPVPITPASHRPHRCSLRAPPTYPHPVLRSAPCSLRLAGPAPHPACSCLMGRLRRHRHRHPGSAPCLPPVAISTRIRNLPLLLLRLLLPAGQSPPCAARAAWWPAARSVDRKSVV